MSLNITNHKNILIKILKDVYTNNSIGPILGFKGGTAAYLFYKLNRFSVDLDFDLLDKSKKDHVFNQLKIILENYGNLKQIDKKRFTLFYSLSYQNKEIKAQNIKVEVNLRNFASKYNVESYLGIAMKVMARADMAAHKLVAMYERVGKANRDIFDVHFFLQNNWPVNKEIIKTRTNLTYKEFLKICITGLEKTNRRDILAGIGELLDEKQKIWVKSNLIDDTIFLFNLELENL